MKSPSVFLSLTLLILVLHNTLVCCKRPDVLNVGAILSYDTVIGKAAKVAMEMAVDDINKDPAILNETQFKLIMEDSNCSVFLGSMKGNPLLFLVLSFFFFLLNTLLMISWLINFRCIYVCVICNKNMSYC